MNEDGRNRFEVPKDMRAMAEAGVEQARKAFDKFIESAQATAGSLEERGATVAAGAKDIGAKAIAYAEKNVQASLDYAQSLLHTKDLVEVMRLHSEYVQAQMRALAESVGRMPSRLNSSKKRQQPTRMPYSWNAQCTTSGCKVTPVGGASTCRAIGLPMSHTS